MAQGNYKVILNVDAEARIPIGPLNLPMRAAAMLVVSIIPAILLFEAVSFLGLLVQLGALVVVIFGATMLGIPTKEGIWIGTYALYMGARRLMPTIVSEGKGGRAKVEARESGIQISNKKRVFVWKGWLSKYLGYFLDVPRAETIEEGIIKYDTTGHHVVLKLAGPAMGMGYDGYSVWCDQFMVFLRELKVPAQYLALVVHYDSRKAEEAFDQSLRKDKEMNELLVENERALAVLVADKSLGLEQYLVLSSGAAGKEGKPYLSRLHTIPEINYGSLEEARRIKGHALRIAKSFQIELEIPDEKELAFLLSQTIVGAQSAEEGKNVLRIDGEEEIILTATKLPPFVYPGQIVDALMSSQCRGIASLHVCPVDPLQARKEIRKEAAIFNYTVERGGGDIGVDVAIAENQATIMAIAQREITPCRMALTIGLQHPQRKTVLEAAEKLVSKLSGDDFKVEIISSPGFLPALALAPGGAPLGRSLQLTSTGVVARLLPALGTPFSDPHAPLVGTNLATGAPAYINMWSRGKGRANSNVVIVGSSGAGKSYTAKTLFIRHIMRGGSGVVLDPDSEYGPIMGILGGNYYELGKQSINPLAAGVGKPPAVAASLLMPVFSVMAGDEKALVGGQPIRRLPDEDQAWMQGQLSDFFTSRLKSKNDDEPILSDFVDYLMNEGASMLITENEKNRSRVISLRLTRYTQGEKGTIFNQPSAFVIGSNTVGIGLKLLAMTYAADLTAALAIVLTQILAGVGVYKNRIILVDEAHRVTNDPDAGMVLGQLCRQFRKFHHGIWMASQQVDDFVKTDLGRILVANASTKLIMGLEETVIPDAISAFNLKDEEIGLLNPFQPGLGILISGAERSPVRVLPGPFIGDVIEGSILEENEE